MAQAAEHARAAGWAAARDVVAHLTRAVGELRPPSADEPAPGLEAEAAQREAAVEAAVAGEGPAVPDLGAEAERRREALRAVLRARQEVARAERERETQFALLEQARETFRRAVDEARAAEGHLEALQDQAAAVLHAWREQARRASVPDFVLAAAIRGIREFPDVQPVVDRLRDPLVDWIERERQALDEEIARLRGERLEPQRRARELEAEIRRLREERDVPPPRAAATERARARLREAGIPAHPLYSVCDFAEGLSEAEQLAIERALEDTGLLDALVVPARRVGEVKALLADPRLADRWIEPRPQVLGYTLAEWLRPALPPGTEGLTAADVIAALRSVVWGLPSGPSVPGPGTVTGGAAVGAPDARDAGAGSASDAGRGAAAGPAAAAGAAAATGATGATEAMAAVDASGAWRLGILAGSSERPEAARPRYIGEGNRRAYRRRRLDELEGELAATQREMARLDGEIAARAAERADLDEDRRALERLDLWSQLVHAAQRRRAAGEARAAADRRVQEAQSQEAWARARWEEAHADYLRRLEPIPEARGRDEDGLHAMLRATEHVTRDLQLVAERLRNLHRRAREIRQWWEEHRRARAEQARLERRLRDDEAEVARREAHCRLLEQRLQAMGIDELRARIRRVTRRRHLLQRADRRMATLLAALGERLRHQEERFREAEAALAEAREREAHWQAELRQRLLAHPSLAEALALFDGDAPGDTEGPARAAAYLLRFRRSQEERRERYVEEDRQKAFNQLSHVFQQERGALAGYLPELDGSTGLVTFREQGRMLRPHELVAELEQRRRFEQQLLEQEERKLYEDVILRRLAAEIRRKIARAERWLAEVNRLLAERPLHGGEVLSLDWRPRLRDRSGSTSGNLQRLVELIRRDADTLTREEVEELIGHFRDNVNRIREQERGNVLAEGFRAALERVLDYREWFDFTLRTRRPGEPVRELTDQRFASRSGAEKSLAVFVPLLAAVHARYQAARPDAPRLVGLDEAFAGVDEGNIQAMFRLMVELDFAWIMTSEKLRGEGAALPACATYTMVPGEGIVVPVLSVWDGERRLEGLDAGAGPDEVPGDEEPGQQAAEPTPQTGTRPEAGRAGWSTLTPS
ncbi:SbcC/MukB-like Walker B domain-containing protein [Thermaerobacter subterraneus]|uniref:TIGR02680 family protein n=1 Tax=Thermaerobacter subterraneus DSM 13965 TaxID=867903 RepID=K6PR04_9FIRM|nr:SbcC/MukB-like Walker B domain-containing protein [Thermaerobacter subterraneus]EKP95372.1 hypothetical protein ThesuDRAFT_01123 [Thermaerobacter subterraneus DSM 13965]